VIEEVFARESGVLWGVCYRMTGCAADADDLVQDTFARALERPPAGEGESWRPWLVKVAMNLARDHLRRRRRLEYAGPWLPSPVEDPVERTERAEAVSFAWLLALEALTPQQRAVLILREVLEYSVAETAGVLGISEANAKVVHHRARKALEKERSGKVEAAEASGKALAAFMEALRAGDGPRVAALVAADVRSLSDGGGEVLAAARPVVGREAVVKFFLGLAQRGRARPRAFAWRTYNGAPALVLEFEKLQEKQAERALWRCELDEQGLIREIHCVLAPRKLTRVGRCA
jgi:RNA polymerase sigma-70 factor (ECF subfamily)